MGILRELFGRSDQEKKPSPETTGVCDVCSAKLAWSRGYGLTTTQVVTSEAYWEYLLTHQGAVLHTQDPNGVDLGAEVVKAADQSDVWLLCQSCARLFNFDREAGTRFATDGIAPPGIGPANRSATALAAAFAWSKTFDSWPSSIKLREEPAPTDTAPCDFCRRTVYSDERLCLLNEGGLEAIERMGGLKRRSGPSMNIAGRLFWMACEACSARSHRITGHLVTNSE
jgi:hypothetical protein